MPREQKYPKKPHSSGQARVKINGKPVYLGLWGSPESKEKFYRLMAEKAALAADLPLPDAPCHAITVAELLAEFTDWAKERYVKNGRKTSESGMYKAACVPVLRLYGSIPADDFGPLALMACRQDLLKRHCRTKVNSLVGRIRRIWKWGVVRELVSEAAWVRLQAVEGIRRGQGGKEMPPVLSAPEAAIAAIERDVLPPVWAMIQLQRFTGMRPGEVTIMRTCDIQQDDPSLPEEARGLCWTYRPHSHKTEHHERGRLILLGPDARRVLEPWLRVYDPEAYLFCPREAVAYWQKLRRAARKSKVYGERLKRKFRCRGPGLRYTTESYGKAITRACLDAKVESWTPGQLRHNAATLIKRLYGREMVRLLLGHSSQALVDVYAENDLVSMAKAVAAIG